MAIEKGLYKAPESIDEQLEEGDESEELELDIEIIEPEMVTLDDGSVEITLIPDTFDMASAPFDANLAEFLEDSDLASLAETLIEEVENDIDSRKDWADTYVKGLDVLGFKYEERSEPWEGACGVFSTVLAESAIRFQAETMSETFPSAGPVKTKIIGESTDEKEEAAVRVREDMNYELTENMVEYRPEHERMLYSLGLAGSAFKKVYFDPTIGRQTAVYIGAEDVAVPYSASNIQSAERVTHIMRKTENELAKFQSSGFYLDTDLGEPVMYHTDIEKKKAEEGGLTLNEDDRYALYEIHADLIIDGTGDSDEDGLAKPYVVTIDSGSQEVLAIRRNWSLGDELFLKRQHFVHYSYVPGFGFYGLGLIHIIGGYARAGTSIIRQLVDAGTLSNLPGGLKTRGLRIKGDDTPVSPGEWRDVDVPGGALKDNLMPMPYGEPSQTLLALLDKITQEGRRLGAIADMDVSDMSANAPVGTTLALLERTLKPMAAVQARVHYAMKMEFKLLRAIMAENAPEEYGYVPERGAVSAKRSDYEMVEVIPVSDPNSSTMAQRVVQYQAVLQMSQQAPEVYNIPELHRQMIEVLGVKNADKLVPVIDELRPVDPISENMASLKGDPMKAFIYQDHDAHIATHMAFMQDPMIMQTIGQNPQAQMIMASLHAHIAEHLGFTYRRQIEDKLGVAMPPPNEQLPKEVEVNLARLVASASQQLTQQKQKQAAQAEAQEQANDPMFQLQQKEVGIKEAEVQRKSKKDQADFRLKQAEQAYKAAEMELKQAEQERKDRDSAASREIDKGQLNVERGALTLDEEELKLKAREMLQPKEPPRRQ